MLDPLLHDLSTLEQNGVFVPLLGQSVKGTVQAVVADNLGAHGIGGFVESFSGEYFCRFCLGKSLDMQSNEVRSGAFIRRSKDVHETHLKFAEENGTSCYGVKKPCAFTKRLEHFHVLSGYPPDVMLDLFEGIVPVELAHCLALLIDKKYFTLQSLNESIQHFPYKGADKTNKPHVLPCSFASRKTVGSNAHENWRLLRLLPFLIGHTVPEDEPAWQVLMDRKDIVELVVAPVHTEESVAYV